MKIEFENYKNRQGFRKNESTCAICRIKKETAHFNKCAIEKYGFKPHQSLIWGISEDNLPCFKLCEKGRKISFYKRNNIIVGNSAFVRVATFIAEKFQGKFIIDEIENGTFLLRKYEGAK